MGFDVNVSIGEKTRLYNSYLYDLTLAGDLHVGGTTAAPDVDGKVVVNHGYLRYLSNKFKVEEGVAETVALLKEFEDINAAFAEPMDDDAMNKLIERQG